MKTSKLSAVLVAMLSAKASASGFFSSSDGSFNTTAVVNATSQPFPIGTTAAANATSQPFPSGTSIPISSCVVLVNATSTFLSGSSYPTSFPGNSTVVNNSSSIVASTEASGASGSPAAITTGSTNSTGTTGSPAAITTGSTNNTGTQVPIVTIYATLYSANGTYTTVFPSSFPAAPTWLPLCGNASTNSSSQPSNTNGTAMDSKAPNSGVATKHNMAVVLLSAVAAMAAAVL